MDMFEDDEDITDDLPMDVHLDTLSHNVVDNHDYILDIYPPVSTSHSLRPFRSELERNKFVSLIIALALTGRKPVRLAHQVCQWIYVDNRCHYLTFRW